MVGEPLSVFISYSRTDSVFVDRLEADLQVRNFRTWVDRRRLEGGQNWYDELEKAIQRCQILLVVLSPEAIASSFVRQEYRYAQKLKKLVIPLEYRAIALEPMDLIGIQWVGFTETYEQGLSELLVALRHLDPTTTDSGLNDLYRAGVTAKAEGDLERTATFWQQVLDRDPNFSTGALAVRMKELMEELHPIRVEHLRERAEATLLTTIPEASASSAPTVGSTSAQPEMSRPASPDVSPTGATTPASQGAFLPTKQALPAQSSAERPAELSPVVQAEQRTEGAPAAPVSQPPATDTAQPSQRGISRRRVIVGLAGLVVAGVAGSGLIWLTRPHSPTTAIPTPSPTHSSSTTTPLPVGTTLYTYRGHSDSVTAVVWSPNGQRIASGSYDKTVQVWDAATGDHVYTYRGHSMGVTAVAWSPDGKRIASVSLDKTVQVWDAADGGHVYTYRGHSNSNVPFNSVTAVAWSPDGRRIASGSYDKTVQVWDAADGGHVYIYRGHSSYVWAVVWSPNGQGIASGSSDKTVQVWDAADGGHVYTYGGHSSDVYAVAWSPDGRRIASGSGQNQGSDHTVQVWVAMV